MTALYFLADHVHEVLVPLRNADGQPDPPKPSTEAASGSGVRSEVRG